MGPKLPVAECFFPTRYEKTVPATAKVENPKNTKKNQKVEVKVEK